MIARIRTWSTINLSYGAKTQLINFILQILDIYWAQVFIIPRSVLNEVIKACRAFLWSGQSFSQKPGVEAWEDLCWSKSSGCLGFRDVRIWNVACLSKYVWTITSK